VRRIIGDLPLLLIATALSLYGVAMVYSAGVTDTPTFVHNLYRSLFLRITNIAERANESYSSLVAFGLLGCWLVHIIVNVGMTVNLMPITGSPLPFFSYGGSFMLASWLAIGILMQISHEGRGVPRMAL
jgi:cell division protein FtsW (lipid II flippase)